MLPHSFTSSGRWPHLLDCNFQIFQIWGGKWLKCRQCSLFSDKGLATTGLRNNVWGGRRASQVNDTCCCWYKVAVILSFEVETLYLTAGIIIFDTLVPRAFQKYTTCMVFKAVQLFKKSAIWFSENEGGGSKAVWNFSENSSVLVGGGFPYLWRIEQLWYSGKEQNRELTLLFEPKNPLPGGIQCVANAMRLNPKFYFKVWYTRP